VAENMYPRGDTFSDLFVSQHLLLVSLLSIGSTHFYSPPCSPLREQVARTLSCFSPFHDRGRGEWIRPVTARGMPGSTAAGHYAQGGAPSLDTQRAQGAAKPPQADRQAELYPQRVWPCNDVTDAGYQPTVTNCVECARARTRWGALGSGRVCYWQMCWKPQVWPYRWNRLYCSNACRQKAYRRRDDAPRGAQP
jgi:hypothetical protein